LQNGGSKKLRPAWNRKEMQAGLGFTSKEKTKLSRKVAPSNARRD